MRNFAYKCVASMPETLLQIQVLRFRNGTSQPVSDWLAREEPLEIRVRGRSVAVTMRTPGDDVELACGFLLSEGLLKNRSDMVEIAPCEGAEFPQNILNVFLAPSVEFDFERLARHTFASSSCGLCGKASIESVHQHFPPVSDHFRFERSLVPTLPDKVREAQATFSKTGGLHAAGLFDANGKLLVVREDVGRHNAVDKVIGWGFLNQQLPFVQHVLLVSGRASFEIMQKALAARIPVVAAVSAPSSLAVEFAIESGQTLIGFLRGVQFNVYSHFSRIA
ncbi:MAG TPA: formate dehydrogenase accessory sulfurtransferase FdhD [Verrucomicrobiae bacterium]|nr:formate dehydrogenase accessory sulfurtransferase FdhD [Verrucomicrobiae bacterium]